MYLRVKDVKNIMESFAPPVLKESYDNVGLMVGDLDAKVTSILIALDCTLNVIDEAVEKGASLIVTHHPLLFVKPKAITSDNLVGKKVMELIKNNISLYSSHTNLDAAEGGLNDILTELLGYNESEILVPAETVLNNRNGKDGTGRIVTLKEPLTLSQLCKNVKDILNLGTLRYSGDGDMIVGRIAIINGSGKDFFDAALREGADCIITGDTTYHYISDLNEMGVAVIDAGHFETEWPAMSTFGEKLEVQLRERGYDNKVIISECSTSPFKYL